MAFSRFHKQQKHKLLDLWTDKIRFFGGCASARRQWGLSPENHWIIRDRHWGPHQHPHSQLKVMATSSELM